MSITGVRLCADLGLHFWTVGVYLECANLLRDIVGILCCIVGMKWNSRSVLRMSIARERFRADLVLHAWIPEDNFISFNEIVDQNAF